MNRQDFEIRLDIIFRYASWPHTDWDCLNKMAKFLFYRNQWKPFKDLYIKYKQDRLNEIPNKKLPDYNPDQEASDFLIRQMENSGFFFGNGSKTYDEFNKPKGCYLNQELVVKRNLEEEHFFMYFFAFLFTKVSTEEFLSYHLLHTFDNNIESYKRFLLEVRKAHSTAIGAGLESLDNWIHGHLMGMNKKRGFGADVKEKPNNENDKVNVDSLLQLFCVEDDFQKYVDVLKAVDPPVIDGNCRYILGKNSKGSISAWVAVLTVRGTLKSLPNDDGLAKLLRSYFQMTTFTGRSL